MKIQHIWIFLILYPVCIFTLNSQTADQKFNLAKSYEQGGDYKGALRLYQELYDNVKDEKFFTPIVKILKQENRIEELKTLIDERLKYTSNVDLFILAGEIYWQIGNIQGANIFWNKAKEEYGNVEKTYLDLEATMVSLRQFDKAIEVLKEGRKKFPANIKLLDNLIKDYAFIGEYKEGFTEIINLLKSTSDMQIIQSRLYAFMNNDTAVDYIDTQFEKLTHEDNANLLALYSWFLTATDKLEKALDIAIRMDKIRNGKGNTILNFGLTARGDGKYDIALKAFSIIIEMGKESNSYNATIYWYTRTMDDKYFADSLITYSEADTIIKSYNNIIENYPNTNYSEESKLRSAELYENIIKDTNKAIKLLNEVAEGNKNTGYIYAIQALNQLTELYIKQGENEKAKQTINEINSNNNIKQTINTNNKDITYQIDKGKFNQAEILYYEGEIDSAMKIYNNLTNKLDNDIANDALERSSFINANIENKNALKLYAQAEYLQIQNKNQQALNNYNEIIKTGTNELITENAIIKAAEIETNLNPIKANEILVTYIKNNIYPIYGDKALLMLGNIAEIEKRNTDAINYWADILVKYPRSILISQARKKIRQLRNN